MNSCVCSTAAVARRAFLLAALLLTSQATAAGLEVGSAAVYKFHAGSYVKVARIAQLTAKDIGHASKIENINGLLRLANAEGRVDAIKGMQLVEPFNSLPSGDLLLLKCLKSKACDPYTCSDVARRSELHREVVLRRPDLNLVQANHELGAISEKVMVRFFEASGWTTVEGQVGRSGIDGLFVKRNEAGVVREVLIVESKYNTGALQPTDHGLQMSRDWALRKLTQLRLKSPDDPAYQQIEYYIEKGYYRARLWQMKVENGTLKIDLPGVHSKGEDVDVIRDPGTRILAPPSLIVIAAPKGEFERTVVEAYKLALEELARP